MSTLGVPMMQQEVAAGAFIKTAQGINVTCTWDLQNTVS